MTNISSNKTNAYMALLKLGKKRKLILDGAMGTQIQKFKLKDRHYGGKKNKGNNDILNITQPKVIEKIHLSYLEAGADIIETNTFNSNQISQSHYNNNYSCIELNKCAVLIAKRARLKYSFRTKRRVFVAGSVGPTNKSLTVPSDVLKPAYRDISFDEMVTSYKQQINTLLNMGVNILLIETIFDTINAKAALFAYLEICRKLKTEHALVISVTVSDASGRTLPGQTLEAFWHSVSHAKPLSVGLNCALGPEYMKQYAYELSNIVGKPIWIYPNAGFPNEEGKYTQSTDDFVEQIKKLTKYACVLGGCCGTTPEHISKLVKFKLSNKFVKVVDVNIKPNCLFLSGLELMKINRHGFYEIGERANVSGSSRFKAMITSGNYERAMDIVRQQVVHGARIIDINMDDAMLDSEEEMSKFLNLINTEPDLSALPIMIDSSKWNTLLVGMKHIQGRGIINSISLKDGDKQFIDKARLIKMHGCLPITIAFDERGQALTVEQRLEICKRVHKLLTEEVGFTDEEIIIDLNTFAIATGLTEHDRNALELINSIKLISIVYPKINLVLGISNLSFSFRGNNKIRESLHCSFLKYAKHVGLNLGITNVQSQISYNKLSNKIRDLCVSLILNNRQVSIEEILDVFGTKFNVLSNEGNRGNWRDWNVKSRVIHAVISGIDKYIEQDSVELAKDIGALPVIEGVLMESMNIIGKLFGDGKMFLPQIIKAARIMKKAVTSITPLMETKTNRDNGIIVMATVKGDVHDIGKNIVSTILSCNNYQIIDLGIMVSANEIVQTAIKYKANAIGISGLISPSLDEMVKVARLLQKKSLDIPLLIGGATTSKLHTAIKLYPEYPNGIVIHVKDASKAVDVLAKLFKETRTSYIKMLRLDYELITGIYNRSKSQRCRISFEASLNRSFKLDKRVTPNVNFIGTKTSFVGNIKSLYIKHGLNENYVVMIKETKLQRKILNKMISERWVSIKRTIGMMKAINRHGSICILNSKNSLITKLPMLRQQQNSNLCLSLSDFVDGKNDNISIYCCVVGIESTLIHQYFNDKNWLQCASAFKTICDDLVETCSKTTYDTIRYHVWAYACKHSHGDFEGKRMGIRPAPGYPIIPDHRIKHNLSRILSLKSKIGLMISDAWSFIPQTSILSMVVANPYAIYFGIKYIDKQQIISYCKQLKQSVKSVERSLSPLICYLPESMLT
ncbi:B12-dependent methionine synthase [Candidatus Hodgkinia cicadicola]|nr:MAG: B12-dependent methionine synthase [Candidatus Hodgkinia cicadicola]PIM96873.1 B12-dependent methionine synthase [Candidatus Hodgkinia cicadicola]